MGYLPYQLVLDFLHQQYLECGKINKNSTSNPIAAVFLSFEMIHVALRETRQSLKQATNAGKGASVGKSGRHFKTNFAKLLVFHLQSPASTKKTHLFFRHCLDASHGFFFYKSSVLRPKKCEKKEMEAAFSFGSKTPRIIVTAWFSWSFMLYTHQVPQRMQVFRLRHSKHFRTKSHNKWKTLHSPFILWKSPHLHKQRSSPQHVLKVLNQTSFPGKSFTMSWRKPPFGVGKARESQRQIHVATSQNRPSNKSSLRQRWRNGRFNKKISTRWFNVTFSSPSWRSLNHLKGSHNHPKKGTKNCQVPGKPSALFLRQ